MWRWNWNTHNIYTTSPDLSLTVTLTLTLSRRMWFSSCLAWSEFIWLAVFFFFCTDGCHQPSDYRALSSSLLLLLLVRSIKTTKWKEHREGTIFFWERNRKREHERKKKTKSELWMYKKTDFKHFREFDVFFTINWELTRSLSLSFDWSGGEIAVNREWHNQIERKRMNKMKGKRFCTHFYTPC